MPNAKDDMESIPHRFLAVGPIGTGKSTQAITLPGKKFAYFFDPSGPRAVKGYDIDYEEFTPTKLNVTVTARPKKENESLDMPPTPTQRITAFAYAKWEEHFMRSLDDGFFDQYDTIIFDSITTFADIGMDDVLARAGRTHYPPEVGDYNVIKLQLSRTLRVLCALNKTLWVTGHTMFRQQQDTHKLLNEILITGDLQTRGPLLFSSVFLFDYEVTATGKKFYIQSVIDKFNLNLKSDIRNIKPKEEVTVTDWNESVIGKQGIGRLIAKDVR